MYRLPALALLCIGAFLSATAADYEGRVGKMKAVFSLDWNEDGSVTGSYSYAARPGTIYTLQGENPREGELSLVEYTAGERTATCQLWKRVKDGTITWEGEMRNGDGRRFPLILSRVLQKASVTAESDSYETERAAILKAIRPSYHWEEFPLAEQTVEMVPVHFEKSQHFNGRVTHYRSGADGVSLSFLVGEWDGQDLIRYEGGPEVTLRMARPLPLAPATLVGANLTVVFSGEGTLLSVDLCSILVTHARVAASGKLEIRGAIDLWRDTPLEVNVAKLPVIELLPDKLALFERGASSGDEVPFQSIRLVKDYGISIQTTEAGPGSLELESLPLDPASENPWIPVKGADFKAPPAQHTGQAG